MFYIIQFEIHNSPSNPEHDIFTIANTQALTGMDHGLGEFYCTRTAVNVKGNNKRGKSKLPIHNHIYINRS